MGKKCLLLAIAVLLPVIGVVGLCVIARPSSPVGLKASLHAHGYGRHGTVQVVAFCPDGLKLIAGDWDRASLWNLEPLRLVQSYQGGDLAAC